MSKAAIGIFEKCVKKVEGRALLERADNSPDLGYTQPLRNTLRDALAKLDEKN